MAEPEQDDARAPARCSAFHFLLDEIRHTSRFLETGAMCMMRNLQYASCMLCKMSNFFIASVVEMFCNAHRTVFNLLGNFFQFHFNLCKKDICLTLSCKNNNQHVPREPSSLFSVVPAWIFYDVFESRRANRKFFIRNAHMRNMT